MKTKAIEIVTDYCELRYILIDPDTGEVVDDAQGYGYRTAVGAHRAYGWKSKHRPAYNHRTKMTDGLQHKE